VAGASGRPASILLIDDHAVIGAAMVVALQAEGFDPVVAVDAEDLSVEAVLGAARSMNPDIALLDVNLGRGRAGLPMIAPLTRLGVKVLLFTASSDPTTVAAGLRLGVEAVLDKAMSFQKVVGALRDVAAGRELMPRDEREALLEALERDMEKEHSRLRGFEALTEREAQVLCRLIEGDSPKAIARDEGISVSTVRGHIEHILQKLQVSTQREALAQARMAGWPAESPGEEPLAGAT
jgi:two-component system, NarL family, nitrate/nitrite response regulator NarL